MIKYMVVAEAGKKLSQNVKSAREAQRMAVQFSRPLADVTDLINENIAVLQKHAAYLEGRALNLEEIGKSLYFPEIRLQITELKNPITVCTSAQCCEVYLESNKKRYSYKQKCHDPCFLNNIPEDIIGSSDLMYCAAMNNQYYCKRCSCHYTKHMHVFYLTRKAEAHHTVKDNTDQKIKARNTMETLIKELLEKLKVTENEYTQERTTVVKIMAKFSYFLEQSGSPLTQDPYQKYLQYLISREIKCGGDEDLIGHYKSMLTDYLHERSLIPPETDSLTLEDLFDSVETLYDLKHTGDIFRQLHSVQKKCLESNKSNNEQAGASSNSLKQVRIELAQEDRIAGKF